MVSCLSLLFFLPIFVAWSRVESNASDLHRSSLAEPRTPSRFYSAGSLSLRILTVRLASLAISPNCNRRCERRVEGKSSSSVYAGNDWRIRRFRRWFTRTERIYWTMKFSLKARDMNRLLRESPPFSHRVS